MRIIIVGCGSIGKRHLRNLRVLGERELVGVDPRMDRRREIEQQVGAVTYDRLQPALEDGADAVFVVTPPALHIPAAMAAVRAGCHLFIEKPLSHSLDSVDDLMKEAEARRLTVFVGSNWKFHPSFRRMKSLLDKGTIGRVTSARCQFGQFLPDWHPWEDFRQGYSAKRDLGGGVLLDSHEFDYLLWYLGPVSSVACFAGHVSSLPVETEDTASVLLRFASGAIGHVHLDYVQRAYQRSCEFHGEEGTLRWDIRDRAVRLYQGGQEAGWTVFEEPVTYDLNQMYVDEVRHFLNCVRGSESPLTDLRQGMAAVKLMLAAKASQTQQRAIDVA